MLKQRAFQATLWSGADIFLRQALQFTVTIALARLLTPSDFGTIALLALFIGIASALLDGGFSAALIQRQDVDHADESTVFWFNLGIGAVMALCLCAVAPAIASFYGVPVLRPLMVVMALVVFVSALGAIHSTLLAKRLDIRTQMKVGLLATIASGGTAAVMAWKGYGVWALAAQAVVMASVTTSLLWIFNPWRPAWLFSHISVRKLFGFGSYHLASILLEIIYGHLYTILIGKLYSTRELGLYNNAANTQQMPGTFLAGVLARVAFPMFSEAAHDKTKLRRGMQLSIRGMMLLHVPSILGIAALAEPLVRTLFGTQWLPAVPILRVLCLAGLWFPLHVINLHVLMAQGHSRLMFRLEVTKKILGVSLIAAGAFYGVMGIAWSQVVFSVVALAINSHYTRKFLDYGVAAQLRDYAPVLSIAIPMAAVVYAIDFYWHPSPLMGLAVLSLFGALLFFGLAWLFRLDALHDVALLFRRAPNGASDSHGVA